MLELTTMNIYLGAAIELIPRDELMRLVNEFDEKATSVSVSSLSKLFEDYGEDFAVPFANLALEHANSDSAKAKMKKAARKLSKAAGSAASGAAGAAASGASGAAGNALGWFSAVSTFILQAAGSAGSIIDAVNGTGAKTAEAVIKQQEAAMEKERTTRWLIVGAIVFVVALIALFVIKQMFGSRH